MFLVAFGLVIPEPSKSSNIVDGEYIEERIVVSDV